MTNGNAYNCATFEKYKILLRNQMDKPHAVNHELKRLLDLNYRPNAKIGNGSTAAAIRYERRTGNKVSGKLHSQKGENHIKAFENWLNKNPNATPGDRAAAENVIKDLMNALE
jgi:hypothetical protein